MFIKLSPHCITSHLSGQVMARHKAIEHALRTTGYTVKPNIVTWFPGRAAVLSRVIVPNKAVRAW